MPIPSELTEPAAAIAARLVERGETVAAAESSAGGLISAALLSVPGASAYYLGGAVIYTATATRALMAGAIETPKGMRGATDTFAEYLAASAVGKLGTTWGVSETGAAGPAGNPYGDPAGHSWVAVSGPGAVTVTSENVRTGSDDREANMVAFAAAALGLLLRRLSE